MGGRTVWRAFSALVVSWLAAMALVVTALIPAGGGVRDLGLIAVLLGAGLAVGGPLLVVPAVSLMSRLRPGAARLRPALAGGAAGVVLFGLESYLLEGLEHGLAALFADAATWVWLASFVTGGAVFGLRWAATAGLGRGGAVRRREAASSR